ncbi:actin-related protein 2/3 complex subunit 2B-like isoform X2 [Triticum dicoccoides]|uniref:actin-related protein 2/3 complex subunit 2B-like isoform X2 n=1 Tax=Triticum dicoccoides TaxID=85692 RepID=UPI00188F59C5|nr:actin-related protein 2/3 complex subunit 2B-like isoform X2 [Triticum dicoccoides]
MERSPSSSPVSPGYYKGTTPVDPRRQSHGVLQRRVAGAGRNLDEVPERRETNAGGSHLLRVRISAIPCTGLGIGPRERVSVDIDAVPLPRGVAVDRPAGVHAAGGEEDVPQVRGDRGAVQGRVCSDPEAQLLRPDPAKRCCADRAKAVRQVSLLQSVVLGSQLKHLLGSLGSSGATKLVYNHRDPFFVSRTPGKIKAIFPMRFRDDTDIAVATSFQELQDAGNSYAKAPKCSWSAIPPPELRGESVQHLTTNGGFVSLDIFERHVKRKRAAKTAWILLNFQAYVKYHIKCTRNYIQSRMRKRQESLAEVIQNARLRGGDDKKKSQVRKKSKRRLFSLGKAKKLQKGFRAVIDGIKRLRLRIRVKALDRFRRCFVVPKLATKKHNYLRLGA